MNPFTRLQDGIEYIRNKRLVSKLYRERFGRPLNWKHPTRFTEKLQIFKISKQAENMWMYADKLTVRSYVEKQIGATYLTKLYGTYADPSEIDFSSLPKSFALKTTHGSGWNILCPDKKRLSVRTAKKKLAFWLTQNYYTSYGRERQYKLAPPRILCEEYLETKDKSLYDIKFYCFHGEPKFINVIRDRSGVTKKAFYEIPWKKSSLQPWDAKGDLNMACPKDLDKMMDLARILSKPFEQIRVDLYNVNGRILFGELTLSCSSGMKVYTPDRFDELFGSLW